MIERVKINLRRQEIQFFNYDTDQMPAQPLYRKSRFIDPGFPHYEDQVAFDAQLGHIKALDLSGFGPSRAVLDAVLNAAGVRVAGFTLTRAAGAPANP